MRRGFVGLPVLLIVLILGASLGAFYYFYYYQKQPGVKSPFSVFTPDSRDNKQQTTEEKVEEGEVVE